MTDPKPDPKPKPLTIHVCGPSRPTCKCQCPDGPCEHEWGGWEEYEAPGGGQIGTQVCSKCGMARIDHDMWVMP